MTLKIEQLNQNIADLLKQALQKTDQLAQTLQSTPMGAPSAGIDPLIALLCVFTLAIFVGYYVVWKVTPALHSPLMAVTNAISSVIIVGGLIGAGISSSGSAQVFGLLAIFLASINIFGGFAVTARMLEMFKRKKDQ